MLRNLLIASFMTLSGCSMAALPAGNFVSGEGIKLRRLYFNLYTDSLKPVLNYYVNVEGETPNGSFLPLDATDVVLTSNWGQMQGNEWIIPQVLLYDNVTFTATSRQNPDLSDRVTIWIQKRKDPRDAPGYEAPGTENAGSNGSGRR